MVEINSYWSSKSNSQFTDVPTNKIQLRQDLKFDGFKYFSNAKDCISAGDDVESSLTAQILTTSSLNIIFLVNNKFIHSYLYSF
jgi:hypothetical protein